MAIRMVSGMMAMNRRFPLRDAVNLPMGLCKLLHADQRGCKTRSSIFCHFFHFKKSKPHCPKYFKRHFWRGGNMQIGVLQYLWYFVWSSPHHHRAREKVEMIIYQFLDLFVDPPTIFWALQRTYLFNMMMIWKWNMKIKLTRDVVLSLLENILLKLLFPPLWNDRWTHQKNF